MQGALMSRLMAAAATNDTVAAQLILVFAHLDQIDGQQSMQAQASGPS
jgi:hypothetical protein